MYTITTFPNLQILFLCCLLLDLAQDKPGVKKVWQRTGEDERHTDGIHSIISTPIVLGKHVYGVDSYGELRCLDLKTGDRVWEDQTATPRARWSTIYFVKNGENISVAGLYMTLYN